MRQLNKKKKKETHEIEYSTDHEQPRDGWMDGLVDASTENEMEYRGRAERARTRTRAHAETLTRCARQHVVTRVPAA